VSFVTLSYTKKKKNQQGDLFSVGQTSKHFVHPSWIHHILQMPPHCPVPPFTPGEGHGWRTPGQIPSPAMGRKDEGRGMTCGIPQLSQTFGFTTASKHQTGFSSQFNWRAPILTAFVLRKSALLKTECVF